MPISRSEAARAAVARASATVRAAARATTRSAALDADTARSGLAAERGEETRQPLVEADLGLPAEDLLRAGDVGLANLRIVDGESLEDDLARRSRDADDGLRELEQRHLVGVPEVHGQVLVARCEQEETANE